MRSFNILFLLLALLLKGYSVEITAKTLLVKSDHGRKSCIIEFMNSTATIKNIEITNYNNGGVINVDALSNVKLSSVVILGRGMIDEPFECSGVIELDNIKINFLGDEKGRITSFADMQESNKCSSRNIRLINSKFSNFEIEECSGTLLMKGIWNDEEVEGCSFVNISTSRQTNSVFQEYSSVSFCKLKHSQLSKVEDTFYGRIVSGLTFKTSVEFLCLNTTFSECFREVGSVCRRTQNNYFKNERMNGERKGETITDVENVTEDTSFIKCTFEEDKSSGKSGCIDNRDGVDNLNLVVSECTFDSAKGGYSGAMHCQDLHSLKLTSSSFTNCVGEYCGGGCLVDGNPLLINIDSCNFTSCSTQLSDGGGLYINENSTSSGNNYNNNNNGINEENCIVSNCNFVSCKASGNGGGIFQDSAKDEIFIRGCFFDGCEANCNNDDEKIFRGGGIYYVICESVLREELYLFDLKFNNNHADDGSDVLIFETRDGKEFNIMSNCISRWTGKNRVCHLHFDESSPIYKNFDYWLPEYSVTFYLSSEKQTQGREENTNIKDICGLEEEKPCYSLSETLSQCSEETTDNISVLISSILIENYIRIINKSITINGKDKEKCIFSTPTSLADTDDNVLIYLSSEMTGKSYVFTLNDLTMNIYSDFKSNFIFINYLYTVSINNVNFNYGKRASSGKSGMVNDDDDDSLQYFVSAGHGCELNINNCNFDGNASFSSSTSSSLLLKELKTNNNNNNNKYKNVDFFELCEYKTGAIESSEANVKIANSSFVNLIISPFYIRDSNMTLTNITLKNNGPKFDDYESMKRNGFIIGSNVSIYDISEESDGFDLNSSLFISSSDNTVFEEYREDKEVKRISYGFIPSISKMSTKLGSDKNEIKITVEGTNLFPCGMGFLIKKKNENNKVNEEDTVVQHVISIDESKDENNCEFSCSAVEFDLVGKSIKEINNLLSITLYTDNNIETICADYKLISDFPTITKDKNYAWIAIPISITVVIIVVVVVVVIIVVMKKRKRVSNSSDDSN